MCGSAQDPIVKEDDSHLRSEFRGLAVWRPASIYAIRLLALGLGDGHPDALAHMAVHAPSIRAAVAFTLDKAEVQQSGGEKSKRDLKAVRGRVDALLLLKEKGVAEVLGLLSSLLPPLVRPGIPPASSCG